MVGGPVDPRVSERIVAETGGNPLGLVEFGGELTAEECSCALPLTWPLRFGGLKFAGFVAWLLWRDGSYTVRWWSNLMLSPIIYVAAGLLWNLEGVAQTRFDERRVRLSFTRADWPAPPPDTGFIALLPYALPPVLVERQLPFERDRDAGHEESAPRPRG